MEHGVKMGGLLPLKRSNNFLFKLFYLKFYRFFVIN